MRRNRKAVALLIGCGAALVHCGCVMGPRFLEASRVSYNEMIQRTDNEQLLLNLVRLKYRETPVFLEVGSVSAQFVFEQSASFVQSSRRLGLEESDGGTRVAAEVYIRNDRLRLQAATLLLPKLKPPPRVLVLIAEEVAGDSMLSAGVVGTH